MRLLTFPLPDPDDRFSEAEIKARIMQCKPALLSFADKLKALIRKHNVSIKLLPHEPKPLFYVVKNRYALTGVRSGRTRFGGTADSPSWL